MKRKIVFTVVIAATLGSLLTFMAMALFLRPTTLDISTVNLNAVADGEYIGICQNKILFAVVKVEVADHRIIGIDILEHKKSYLEQARTFADNVVSAGSLEVDAVSGATLTSPCQKTKNGGISDLKLRAYVNILHIL